jgi:hypothetical protein
LQRYAPGIDQKIAKERSLRANNRRRKQKDTQVGKFERTDSLMMEKDTLTIVAGRAAPLDPPQIENIASMT